MIQQLIILGFLKSGPFSGYDIKKLITRELGIFFERESTSIYYPLKKLEKEEFIKKEKRRSGNYPQKYVYSITNKGEDLFRTLCEQALSSTKRPFIELDIALYFLPFLDNRRVITLLRLQIKFLEKVKGWLLEKKEELHNAPKNFSLLLDHHERLAAAERDFLTSMLHEIKR